MKATTHYRLWLLLFKHSREKPIGEALVQTIAYSAVVERRGWCWAMTHFGVDAYKASEKDLLAEDVALRSASEEFEGEA